MKHERKLRNPTNPNLFHGSEYPLTFWFFKDAFHRPLEDREQVGFNKLNEVIRPPNGVISVAYLYWMIDADGEGSVHCFGREIE